jgi:hypothetical protein
LLQGTGQERSFVEVLEVRTPVADGGRVICNGTEVTWRIKTSHSGAANWKVSEKVPKHRMVHLAWNDKFLSLSTVMCNYTVCYNAKRFVWADSASLHHMLHNVAQSLVPLRRPSCKLSGVSTMAGTSGEALNARLLCSEKQVSSKSGTLGLSD